MVIIFSSISHGASSSTFFENSMEKECEDVLYYDATFCQTLRDTYDEVVFKNLVSKADTELRSEIAANMIEFLTDGKQNCWAQLVECAKECTQRDPKLRRLFITEAIANYISQGRIFDATKPYLASLELLEDAVGRTDLHKLVIYNDSTMPEMEESTLKSLIDSRTHLLGMTPLHYAVILNKPTLVSALLGWGADVTIRSNFPDCETAVDIARRLNRPEILAILKLFEEPFVTHPSGSSLCRAKVFAQYLAHKAKSLFQVSSSESKEL